jgi:FAD/FMN-containing dehydrogenase
MTTKHHNDTNNSGLDDVDAATHEARDATHFRRIITARQRIDDAENELRAAVQAAREAGDSWTVIGAALDTTRQAAYQRFGRS